MLLMLPFTVNRLFAQQPWIVPDDQKGELATFRFTDEVVAKGAAVFAKNCQSCHGQPGKANWAKLVPEPGDPASAKFQKDSDGELFYKISNGRGPMPQFRTILSEEERWQVIAYVRTFHQGYIQPDPETAKAKAKGGKATLSMKYDTVTGKLVFGVTHTKDKVTTQAANAKILVFVKRYFGTLQAGETKTNDKGYASFDFPKEIPGDSLGMLVVVARLDETSGYGSAEKTDTLKAGNPVKWVSLTDQRAMWNVRSKAPVWLMLTYSLVLIGVGITLVYILFQIRKIHHTGRAIDHPDDPMMS
jgi:mono/diheme cytochrome c family protein